MASILEDDNETDLAKRIAARKRKFFLYNVVV
jgi:hypothetical protein